MLSDYLQAKRFLGAKFGYGEILPDGVYAVPCDSSKGKAFFRLEIRNNNVEGAKNFHMFWDESLTISWYDKPKPFFRKESKWATQFRILERMR